MGIDEICRHTTVNALHNKFNGEQNDEKLKFHTFKISKFWSLLDPFPKLKSFFNDPSLTYKGQVS